MKNNNIYFLLYDGILNPLGYSQILQYVKILSTIGKVKLITFEKIEDLKKKNLKNKIYKEVKNNNIYWSKKKYYYNRSKIIHILNLFFNFLFYSIYFFFKKN